MSGYKHLTKLEKFVMDNLDNPHLEQIIEKRYGTKGVTPKPCGTRQKYQHCKCSLCTSANTEYIRQRRAKQKQN